MSPNILSLLVTLMGAAVELSYSSLITTFVVDRDNSTFEIVLQPPRECPEEFYLHKARHGEYFMNDGRDVTKKSHKLCIKCSKCLDGIQVVRHCTSHHDVLCGSKCVQAGFRFDEGTRSCQHEKVLDEGFNHKELREWLAELQRSQNVVSEVGSTSDSPHIETQTADVTKHRHEGLQKTVLGTSQTPTSPTQTSDESGPLFDAFISSDGGEISDDEQTAASGENLPRAAVDDHAARLQELLFIAVVILLVVTVMLYAFAAVRKFRPGLIPRILARQRELPTPVTIEMSSVRVPRAVTVLPSLRTSSTHRDGSREEPQPPDDVSSYDGNGTDFYDDDTSYNEESSMLGDGSLKSPCYVFNDDDIGDNEESSMLGDGNLKSSRYVSNDDDTSDNEESSMLGDSSLNLSCYVSNDDETSDNEESSMLGDSSLNLSCYVSNDGDTSDNEESSMLGDGNLKSSGKVCKDGDTSDNEESSMLGGGNLKSSGNVCKDGDTSNNEESSMLGDGNLNSLLSHVFNDDDSENKENVTLKDGNSSSPLSHISNDDGIGDNEENVTLGDGNPNSPLSHVCNDDDISDNEENGNPSLPLSHVCNDDDIGDNEETGVLGGRDLNLLSRKVRNDISDDDSVERMEPSVQIHHSSSEYRDVIEDVVIHDGDNIKCDDEDSTDDNGSPQSRNIGKELGREEDKTIDDVSEREPSGNEDGFKGENCLSEEVEVQPCSFIDTVIPGDDLHDDVVVTVSKESNDAVIDYGCETRNQDHFPLGSNKCSNVTDESNDANEETKIKKDAEVPFKEDATGINRSKSVWNFLGGHGTGFRQVFRQVSDIKYETDLEVENPPLKDTDRRRRSSSTNENWMSKIRRNFIRHPPPAYEACHGYRKEKGNRYSSDLNGILSVTDKSDEPKTEIKIEDTKVPIIVENASGVNAPQSPESLEAGVDQVGVMKHLVCDAERILVTTECEISREAGNRPHIMTRRRSNSYTSLPTMTNGRRGRSRSTSGDFNPSEREMKSDKMHEGSRQVECQSLSVKDGHFCREEKTHRLDSDEAKTETKKGGVARVPILGDFTPMDSHKTMGVTHEQDGQSKNQSFYEQMKCQYILMKDRPIRFWRDRCYSDGAKKETTLNGDTKVSMLENTFVDVNAPQSPSDLGAGCGQSVGVNRMGSNADKMYVNEFGTGTIPHVMARRRYSTGTYYANSISRTDRRYILPLMRSLEESLPVINDVNSHSKMTLTRRPLSLPTMPPHFEKIPPPVINSKKSSTEGMRLTPNPLSTPPVNFHRVERGVDHELCQQAC